LKTARSMAAHGEQGYALNNCVQQTEREEEKNKLR
jgi:hypothetical protein